MRCLIRLLWLLTFIQHLGCCSSKNLNITIDDAISLSDLNLTTLLTNKGERYDLLGHYNLIDLLAGVRRLQYTNGEITFDASGKRIINIPSSEEDETHSEVSPFALVRTVRKDVAAGRIVEPCWQGIRRPQIHTSVAISIYLWANYTNAHNVDALLEESIYALDCYFVNAQRERYSLAYDGLICCLLYHSFLNESNGRLLTKEVFFQENSAEALAQMKQITSNSNWVAKAILFVLGVATENMVF